MSTSGINFERGQSRADGPRVVRVTPNIEFAAARRLVSASESDLDSAARRLVSAAPKYGIDFHRCWVVLDDSGVFVRQACLVVPGAGRTAMVFLSDPPARGDAGGPEAGLRERTACLSAAIESLRGERGPDGSPRSALAQALPEPRESWVIDACVACGFQKVGDLSYMRCRVEHDRARGAGVTDWGGGVEVLPVASLPDHQRDPMLIEALDASYVGTLDCPELCGLRDTTDILVSHKSTGVFDPALWWIVRREQRPMGCMLLSRCPEQGAVELVYLGLSPELRGLGIGSRLMKTALWAVEGAGYREFSCAVDRRNVPAVRLYESCGFRATAQRVALVKPVI
jgi:GNAT superfamily N-acetyltransferase